MTTQAPHALDQHARRAIWWLGATQCVLWGVLYYGFSVWLTPMHEALGVSPAAVAGAFSFGLLAMAMLAPRVGRAFDRGQGRVWIRAGVVAATLGLLLLSRARSLPVLYAAWLLLGSAMAALLYESAFALVQRAITDPARRLRALAAVTVMGGLASTIFLPLLGWLVERIDWRTATTCGAGAVLLAGATLERHVLPVLREPRAFRPREEERPVAMTRSDGLASLMLIFGTTTIAVMGLTTLLVPRLLAEGVSLSAAASVLAALGVAQLPGRLWILRGDGTPPLTALTAWPLLLQAIGMLLAAWMPSLRLVAVGVGLSGLGAGLHTLARPWLVQQRFGAEANHRNGQIARLQGFGRAAAPALLMAAAHFSAPSTVLTALGIVLLVLVPVAIRMGRTPPPLPVKNRGARGSRRFEPTVPVHHRRAVPSGARDANGEGRTPWDAIGATAAREAVACARCRLDLGDCGK
jgi:MFS family permease